MRPASRGLSFALAVVCALALLPAEAAAAEGLPCFAVVLGDDEDLARAAAAALTLPEGCVVPSSQALLEALTGVAGAVLERTRDPAPALELARTLEAHFDTARAATERAQLIADFQHLANFDAEVVAAAAAAMHDEISARVAAGGEDAARAAADATVAMFPHAALDRARHSPHVQALLEQAQAAAASRPSGVLDLEVEPPATVFVDGLERSAAAGALRLALRFGVHRVHLASPTGRSFVRRVELADAEPTTLRLSLRLDTALWLERAHPLVRCADDCDELGALLAASFPRHRLLGVRRRPGTDEFEVGPLPATKPTALAHPSRSRWSAWSLVPGGVGQLAQGRPVAAAGWFAAQAALATWHVSAIRAHARRQEDPNRERELRHRQNVSAALLSAALVGSVVEALLVGAITDE